MNAFRPSTVFVVLCCACFFLPQATAQEDRPGNPLDQLIRRRLEITDCTLTLSVKYIRDAEQPVLEKTSNTVRQWWSGSRHRVDVEFTDAAGVNSRSVHSRNDQEYFEWRSRGGLPVTVYPISRQSELLSLYRTDPRMIGLWPYPFFYAIQDDVREFLGGIRELPFQSREDVLDDEDVTVWTAETAPGAQLSYWFARDDGLLRQVEERIGTSHQRTLRLEHDASRNLSEFVVPSKLVFTHQKRGQVSTQQEMLVLEARFDPVDPAVFTLPAGNFPPGTEIRHMNGDDGVWDGKRVITSRDATDTSIRTGTAKRPYLKYMLLANAVILIVVGAFVVLRSRGRVKAKC